MMPALIVLRLLSWVFAALGAVALAIEVDPAAQAQIAHAMTLVGGAFAGLFWGRILTLFRRALGRAGESGDYASVARLLSRPAQREGASS